MNSYTPAAYTPAAAAPTPAMGAPTPAGIATPWGQPPPAPRNSSYNSSSSNSNSKRFIEGIVVRIIRDRSTGSTYQNGLHLNQTAKILSFSQLNQSCSIKLINDGSILQDVKVGFLEPVIPSQKGEFFIVLSGTYRGEKYKVAGFDADDCMGISDSGNDQVFPRSNIAVAAL